MVRARFGCRATRMGEPQGHNFRTNQPRWWYSAPMGRELPVWVAVCVIDVMITKDTLFARTAI